MASSTLNQEHVRKFLDELFQNDVHAKRVLSLANATLGVIQAASLAVNTIGRAVAVARGIDPKHGIKQVDRLLSNGKLDVWHLFAQWVPYVLGQRTEAVVALDWTEFEPDDQVTLAASLITSHGRATPLMWKTHRKSEMKGKRNDWEDELVERLREVTPSHVSLTLLADRGFGDQKLYHALDELGMGYVIRFRDGICVEDPETGEKRTAKAWLGSGGRARCIRGALVTGNRFPVESVVVVQRKRMKEPWCLATNLKEASANDVIDLYGKRFTIEENFRDVKDIRFGMGLSSVSIKSPDRRDRLLLVSALAVVLLTLLGAAGEAVGLERALKANTVKRRSHSLFNQGAFYYQWMASMPERRLVPLVEKFAELLRQQAVFREAFGLI